MAKSDFRTAALIRELRARRAAGARELYEALGMSQASFSRLVSQSPDEVLTLGRGRATRYALPRAISGVERDIPLFEVDEQGVAHRVGMINPLHGGETWVARGASGELYEGLPYFLDDMCPQGFLGRAFAMANRDLELPERVTDWNDDHMLRALSARGEDTVGNLLIGEGSLQRFLSAAGPLTPIRLADQSLAFNHLAVLAVQGQPAGSSAGGEHPKFAAYVEHGSGKRAHVLVKFSPPLNSEVGERWSDLLACEAIAADVLHEAGIPAARARILTNQERTHLVVPRFDRLGRRGRRGVVSLGALDDYHFGRRDNYTAASVRLERAGLISAGDAETIRLVHTFGMLIANSDMHFGNISFFTHADGRLELTPVYDMLPMLYAPVNDQVLEREFVIASLPAQTMASWEPAFRAARRFWERVLAHPRISKGFKSRVRGNADKVARLYAASRASINAGSMLRTSTRQETAARPRGRRRAGV